MDPTVQGYFLQGCVGLAKPKIVGHAQGIIPNPLGVGAQKKDSLKVTELFHWEKRKVSLGCRHPQFTSHLAP